MTAIINLACMAVYYGQRALWGGYIALLVPVYVYTAAALGEAVVKSLAMVIWR